MSRKPNPWSSDYDWQTSVHGSYCGQSHPGSDSNIVYVKGTCKNNGREGAQGGIGVHWRSEHGLNISDRYSGRQTNQSASLEAAIKAVEQAKVQNKDNIVVCTDSQLVTKGMNEWIDNWKGNDWKTSKNKDVVHREQFIKLDNLTQGMNVEWNYVPAYSKDGCNVAAQKLARKATGKK
ncbi:ribonuclease H1-like [Macrotis lagotis]|uniref:ribonuclease H1-like n=1 Tax=Macrotis lagotis TaxID=92651 RepID=UPI003D68F7C4